MTALELCGPQIWIFSKLCEAGICGHKWNCADCRFPLAVVDWALLCHQKVVTFDTRRCGRKSIEQNAKFLLRMQIGHFSVIREFTILGLKSEAAISKVWVAFPFYNRTTKIRGPRVPSTTTHKKYANFMSPILQAWINFITPLYPMVSPYLHDACMCLNNELQLTILSAWYK